MFPPQELVHVTIETTLGAIYKFPDMTRDAVERIIKDNISFQGDLVLTNVSKAVLVLPTRIIKTLAINDEVKWRGIDPVHEL
jgi:hypothetical protein